MSKFILAALAALSIAGPVAITTNSTEPQPNNKYIAEYLPSDMRDNLANISNVLHNNATDYLEPVSLWITGQSLNIEAFTMFDSYETKSSLTDSEYNAVLDSLYFDYLLMEGITSITYAECPLDMTRGVLDHLTTLSNETEDVVYYYKQSNASNLYISSRNVYLGLCEILTDFLGINIDVAISQLRESCLELVIYNRNADIVLDNYCTQLSNIVDFANYLSKIEDRETNYNNKEMVEKKYDEFINGDFDKVTSKDLLGYTEDEVYGYYDLTPEEQETFCETYYPNYINSVLYYFFETYRIKVSYVRNEAFGQVFNDLVFPASYKLLDIFEAVVNQEKIAVLEYSLDLVNCINSFEQNNLTNLTVNPSCPDRASFITLVKQDRYMLTTEYTRTIRMAETQLELVPFSFEGIKEKRDIWKTKSEVKSIESEVRTLNNVVHFLSEADQKSSLRSDKARVLIERINSLIEEMNEYKAQIVDEYNRLIAIIIAVSVITVLAAGGVAACLIVANKKRKAKQAN